jgi:hypothetical protein
MAAKTREADHMSEPLSTMERLALKSQHEGHDPHDARVAMVEEMAADMCSACGHGLHRWRDRSSKQFVHVCETFDDADECEAHNLLRIAVDHGVPIYTGAELEFPDATE